MKRRAFLFANFAAAIASSSMLTPAHAGTGVEMIYVGGKDCSFCTMWRKEYEAAWRASPEFRHVDWIEIDPPHLREAYQARYWHGDLRDVLDQLPRKSVTPRFLLVKEGRVMFNEVGVNKWPVMLKHLRQVLAS
jgi:hypothetical protein